MAHYAFLNENNIVIEVISGRNEDEVVDGVSDWEKYYENFREKKCVRTSVSASIRGKYAGLGDYYDSVNDIFVEPKPYPSWVQNGSFWKAPVDMPTDDKMYSWNESKLKWEEVK
jgi:hypothetical protein